MRKLMNDSWRKNAKKCTLQIIETETITYVHLRPTYSGANNESLRRTVCK